MAATFKGKYKPRNPEKYKGNPMLIEHRSSWEREFMKYCDLSEHVTQWSSEEKAIWYYDPIQKKKRRYFPDFIIQYEKNGLKYEEVVEIKPWRQVQGPPANPKRRTQGWMREVMTYATNQAKWKAARIWAEDRGMSFRLLTEKDVPGWSGSPTKPSTKRSK